MRETIDIEDLLQLAYRTWTIDRRARDLKKGLLAGPSASASSNLASVLALGTRVDTSPAGAVMLGYQAEAGAVPDDLWVVDHAVMALDDFWVEQAGADVVVWDRQTAAEMGQTIIQDRAPGRGKAGSLWWVAAPGRARRPLHHVVTSVAVIAHARAATRPEVREPVLVSRKPIYSTGSRKHVARYEETWFPTHDQAAFERAQYGVWHAALGLLVAMLADLERFAVTGPHAPAVGGTVDQGCRRVLADEAGSCKPLPRRAKSKRNKIDREA